MWKSRPQLGRDSRAPVAAVGAEALVAELVHQADPKVDDSWAVGALGRLTRKRISRQGRHDHMECIGRGAAVSRGIDQCGNRGQHLPNRPGITVGHHERDRIGASRLLMDEVDLLSVDGGRVLVEAVEGGFVRAPIVLVLPIGDELAHICQVGSHGPWLPGRVRRPHRVRQPAAQVGKVLVVDMNVESLDVRLRSARGWRHRGPGCRCAQQPKGIAPIDGIVKGSHWDGPPVYQKVRRS